MKRLPLIFTTLLLLASPVFSQNKATVIFYRGEYHTTFKRIAPNVYINDKKVAELDEARYFAVELDPDLYTFRTSDKKKAIKLVLQAGDVYYIRMDVSAGLLGANGRLVVVPSAQGKLDVKQYRPIKKEDAKDERVKIDEKAHGS